MRRTVPGVTPFRCWFTRIAVVVTFSTFLVATVSHAMPASAHNLQTCAQALHNSTYVKSQTRIDHPSSGKYVRGAVGAESRYVNVYCGQEAGNNPNNVNDLYMAYYVDWLQGGSYSQCQSKSHGWRGGLTAGFWVKDTPLSSACKTKWNSYKLRSRTLGKARYTNGDVKSVWSYNSAHATL